MTVTRQHRVERQRWQRKVDAGTVECVLCSRLIVAGSHWSLLERGPVHTRCGFVEGFLGRATSREW